MGTIAKRATPFALALSLVVAAFVVTAGDLAYVALGVMTAAFIVGGAGSGSLVARSLVYGTLASLALVAFSVIAAEDPSAVARVAEGVAAQRYTPLWSMPLAAFGVWAGADFRRSLDEITRRR